MKASSSTALLLFNLVAWNVACSSTTTTSTSTTTAGTTTHGTTTAGTTTAGTTTAGTTTAGTTTSGTTTSGTSTGGTAGTTTGGPSATTGAAPAVAILVPADQNNTLSDNFTGSNHTVSSGNGTWSSSASAGDGNATVALTFAATDSNFTNKLVMDYYTGTSSGSEPTYAQAELTYGAPFSAQDGVINVQALNVGGSTDLRIVILTSVASGSDTGVWEATVSIDDTWTAVKLPLYDDNFSWTGTTPPNYSFARAMEHITGIAFRIDGSDIADTLWLADLTVYKDNNQPTVNATFWDDGDSGTSSADDGLSSWQFQSGSGNSDDSVSHDFNSLISRVDTAVDVTYNTGTGSYGYAQAQFLFTADQNILAGSISFWLKSTKTDPVTISVDSTLGATHAYSNWYTNITPTPGWSHYVIPLTEAQFIFANYGDSSDQFSFAQALATLHSIVFKVNQAGPTTAATGTFSVEGMRFYDTSDDVRPGALLSTDFNSGTANMDGGVGSFNHTVGSSGTGDTDSANYADPNGYSDQCGTYTWANATVGSGGYTFAQIAFDTDPGLAPNEVAFWIRGVTNTSTQPVLVSVDSVPSSDNGYAVWQHSIDMPREWTHFSIPLIDSNFTYSAGGTPPTGYSFAEAINSTNFKGIKFQLSDGGSGYISLDTIRVF